MEKFTETHAQVNLLTDFVVEGYVEIGEFRSCVQTRLLEATKKKDNSDQFILRFPEIRQHPTSWWGCYFWEWDINFCLDNHVVEIQCHLDSDDDLLKVQRDILAKLFPAGHSPWCLYLVHDNSQIATALFMPASPPFKSHLPKIRQIAMSEKFRSALFSPYLALIQFYGIYKIRHRFQCLTSRNLIGHGNANSTHSAVSKLFPLENLQLGAKFFNVSLTGLLLSAVSVGVHKFFKSQGLNISDFAVASIPLAPHRTPNTEVTNSFQSANISLPLWNSNDESRILTCENIFQHTKSSVLFACTPYFLDMVSFSYKFAKSVWKLFPIGPLMITIFPGPTEQIKFDGKSVRFNVMVGRGLDVHWISIFSYNKELCISSAIPTITSQVEANQLVASIHEEIKRLSLQTPTTT